MEKFKRNRNGEDPWFKRFRRLKEFKMEKIPGLKGFFLFSFFLSFFLSFLFLSFFLNEKKRKKEGGSKSNLSR